MNARHTLRVLRRHGVVCDAEAVRTADEVVPVVSRYPTVTHVVIEAPWVPTSSLAAIVMRLPAVHWIVRTHSQLAFLQADRRAFENVRQGLKLQEEAPNFSMAANARQLCEFIEVGYRSRCLYLPNLYDHERVDVRRYHQVSRRVRAASYGALRPGKNHLTAAGAALLAARELGKDLEFHFNTNRDYIAIGSSIHELLDELPGVRVVEDPWSDWPSFRHKIAGMDVVFALSHTESFCLTAADAVAEGVPVVASAQIEWIPRGYRVENADSAADAARVARAVVADPSAARVQHLALEQFVVEGVRTWLEYLDGAPT